MSGANLVGSALSLVESIVVGRLLAPALMGDIGFVMLWSQYASFVRPGLWSAAFREMPALLGQGKSDEAQRIQNAGISAEALWLAVPVIVMLVASLFFADPLVRWGLWLTAAAFVATAAFSYVTEVHWVHQRFGLIARARLGSRLLAPVLGIPLVFAFGAYGVLWKSFLVPVVLSAAIVSVGPPIHYRWTWNRPVVIKLLRIGLPLSAIAVFASAFRLVDRTVVSAWLTRDDLGYLTFALLYINLTIAVITDFGSVLQPVFWTELGRIGDVRPMRQTIERLALIILMAATVCTAFLQAAFPAFVYWFTPRYTAAIPTFEVLAFTTATLTATIMPSLVLESSVVGRQATAAAAWGASVAVNVALAVAAAWLGFGLVGVAWATVLSQLFITTALYVAVHRHLYHSMREALPFYGSAFLCLAGSLTIYAVFDHPALRLLAAAVVWPMMARVLYLAWWRPSTEAVAPTAHEIPT